tara:strand:+ start:1830 stop:2180 length:351 start_codon:yes stop_codon:yes gene_type:complete
MSETRNGSCRECEKRRLNIGPFCYDHSPKCGAFMCNKVIKQGYLRCKDHMNISRSRGHSEHRDYRKKENNVVFDHKNTNDHDSDQKQSKCGYLSMMKNKKCSFQKDYECTNEHVHY